MLLLTALSYRPSWTPRLLLPPARYDPKDQHPGSPHRSPTPRQNVRVLSVPGANRDLLFTGKSTNQTNTYYSAFLTAKIPLLHFHNCGLCIMQDVVFGHECDAWKKRRRPYLLTYPLHQLANVFRHFFATKIEIIPNKLNSVQPTPVSTAAPHVETLLVDFKPVSEGKILEILKTCQPNSCDLDPLPTSLLLECTDSLLSSLMYLINHFLHLPF